MLIALEFLFALLTDIVVPYVSTFLLSLSVSKMAHLAEIKWLQP